MSNSLQPHGLYSPAGSSVHGILQARVLEWVAMPLFRRFSRPKERTHVSYISCTGRQVPGSQSWPVPSSPAHLHPESPASPGSGCSMPESEKFQCQVTIRSEITKSRKVSSLLNQMLPLAPCPAHARLAVGGDRPKGAVSLVVRTRALLPDIHGV